MNTLINEIHDSKVLTVELTDDELIVGLNDGRTIAVPIAVLRTTKMTILNILKVNFFY